VKEEVDTHSSLKDGDKVRIIEHGIFFRIVTTIKRKICNGLFEMENGEIFHENDLILEKS